MLRKCDINFLHSIKKCEETLKFDNIEVNKKEFHKPKQPIDLKLVDTNKIVISGKFNQINDGFKGGKNMSSMIKDNSVLLKYQEIWNKI